MRKDSAGQAACAIMMGPKTRRADRATGVGPAGESSAWRRELTGRFFETAPTLVLRLTILEHGRRNPPQANRSVVAAGQSVSAVFRHSCRPKAGVMTFERMGFLGRRQFP